jgi:hypothetical protein
MLLPALIKVPTKIEKCAARVKESRAQKPRATLNNIEENT